MSKKPALIWTGGGFGGALPGIPGRDLSAEEVKKHGGEKKLIDSGLYKKPGSVKNKKEGD
jgi:hypothetical protein